MSEIKAVVFDADGVVIVPTLEFSRQYTEKYNLDPDSFLPFFKGDFEQALVGKADLKDLIKKHNDVWQWDGDPQELLDMWFAAETATDPTVLEIIRHQRQAGRRVYMATNQEQYRGRYLREVMFPDVFDHIFVSADVGYTKKQPGYWREVISAIALEAPGIKPEEIVFFDDSLDSIDGARVAGIRAYLYAGDVEQIRSVLN